MTLQKFYKTENIITVAPEDTLSRIFSYLSSSHDSAFVMENNQLLGVINPYYCIIKKSYPSNTKAKHCLIHPPKVDINYPLKKVAQLIIDSKIHYLPVFSNSKFLGIISARRILSAIKDADELQTPIKTILINKRPLISVYEDDFLSTALALFKKYRVSKLVVVSKDFKLKGIMAYYDLISYLITPKEKQHWSGREGNKIPLLKRHVRNFMKTNVLTLTKEDKLNQAAEMILEKKIGSIVIIDPERHPIGIITTNNLLSAFIGRRKLPTVQVITKDLSKKSWQIVSGFIRLINYRLIKLRNVSSAKFIIKEKQGTGIFKAILSILSKDNKIKVIKKEGKNLNRILQEVKDKSKNVY
jgi:predicted transcriptional regulator